MIMWTALIVLISLPVLFFGLRYGAVQIKKRNATKVFLSAITPTLRKCQSNGLSALDYQSEFDAHKAAALAFAASLPETKKSAFLSALEGYERWQAEARKTARAEADYSKHDIGIVRVKKINPSLHLKKLMQFAK